MWLGPFPRTAHTNPGRTPAPAAYKRSEEFGLDHSRAQCFQVEDEHASRWCVESQEQRDRCMDALRQRFGHGWGTISFLIIVFGCTKKKRKFGSNVVGVAVRMADCTHVKKWAGGKKRIGAAWLRPGGLWCGSTLRSMWQFHATNIFGRNIRKGNLSDVLREGLGWWWPPRQGFPGKFSIVLFVWHRGVGTSRTVVAKTGEKLSIIQASRCAASVIAHDISGCHDIETRKDNSCLIFGDRPVQHVVSTNRLGPKRCRWNRIVQSFDVGKILEVNNPCPSDISHVSKLFILFALVR